MGAVTPGNFLTKYYDHRNGENRISRRRALLTATRHKTVELPPLAVPRKHGQANKYFTHGPLNAWKGFIDEGVDLPPPLLQTAKCGAHLSAKETTR